MTTTDKIREQGRIRAKRFYNKHKDDVKAQQKSNYYVKRAKMAEHIRQCVAERYAVQLAQAKTGGLDVIIETEQPYRRCQHCNHYSNMVVRTAITPESQLVKKTKCYWCGKTAVKIEYVL